MLGGYISNVYYKASIQQSYYGVINMNDLAFVLRGTISQIYYMKKIRYRIENDTVKRKKQTHLNSKILRLSLKEYCS